VDIRDTALSVDEVLTAVSDAAAGGVTLFVGNVRDHDENKSVTGLEYSPTALPQLTDVAERWREYTYSRSPPYTVWQARDRGRRRRR
jgi:molybdopterin synthase catalytic subunit